MEAQINDRQLPKFRPLLQENQAYYINHFLVLGARKVYRQVENDYMLWLHRVHGGIQSATICAARAQYLFSPCVPALNSPQVVVVRRHSAIYVFGYHMCATVK
jgi:hypothetical protein